MFLLRFFLCCCIFVSCSENVNIFQDSFEEYEKYYGHFSEARRVEMLEDARQMFYFGYDNYMKHAFPQDELDPIHCTGRGPDHQNPSNININDVLGDYALTLVDSLDTLAVMGNSSEFVRAVQLVIEHVSFDKNSTVQVFEATIRVMGGLLSAHLIIIDAHAPFGQMAPPDYDNELLHMAHDLASRLMSAFEDSATGIPFPRVNLQGGAPYTAVNDTCTSGAGTLMLEFGILSRLLGDPTYDSVTRRAVDRLWALRSNVTGLLGNSINIQSGLWTGRMSGLGAGLDSFYEYLLKGFILFGDETLLHKFTESYETIKYYMRKGRKECNTGAGYPPIYVNVNMRNGDIFNNWIDSLQAAWAGVQVLAGDLEEAICTHALYYTMWQRYDSLPERYNWNILAPEVLFYPLRPELVESTYLLYQATKNPFYLHVGSRIMQSINNHTKVTCGYATIHNIHKKDLEDRMESFFLSETCKYLILLFDTDNHVNKEASRYIFSTEGHLFPVVSKFRRKPWNSDDGFQYSERSERHSHGDQNSASQSDSVNKVTGVNAEDKHKEKHTASEEIKSTGKRSSVVPMFQYQFMCNADTGIRVGDIEQPVLVSSSVRNISHSCDKVHDDRRYLMPIKSRYLQQLESMFGVAPLNFLGD